MIHNGNFEIMLGVLSEKEFERLEELSRERKDIQLGAWNAWCFAEEVGLEPGDCGYPMNVEESIVTVPMDIALRVIGRKRMAEIENDFNDDEYDEADELADFLFG